MMHRELADAIAIAETRPDIKLSDEVHSEDLSDEKLLSFPPIFFFLLSKRINIALCGIFTIGPARTLNLADAFTST